MSVYITYIFKYKHFSLSLFTIFIYSTQLCLTPIITMTASSYKLNFVHYSYSQVSNIFIFLFVHFIFDSYVFLFFVFQYLLYVCFIILRYPLFCYFFCDFFIWEFFISFGAKLYSLGAKYRKHLVPISFWALGTTILFFCLVLYLCVLYVCRLVFFS